MVLSRLSIVCAAMVALSAPALARPGGWGGAGWGGPGWGVRDSGWSGPGAPDRSREGRITVSRFISHDPLAAGLGHGAIVVTSGSPGDQYLEQQGQAVFEAAMVDRLAKAGYDVRTAHPEGGHALELTVQRTELEPAERKKPVSGEAGIEVGNRGTGYNLAIAVDLSKPLPPLIGTRVEARIRDRATGTVLWEGRAEVTTREGAKGWGDQEIAARLASALLDGFPSASDGIARAG
jgi:hypothetical protein